MPTPILHEQWVNPNWRKEPSEDCSLCGTPTRYWNRVRDVTCCPTCAKTHKVADLPTKRAWFDAVDLALKTGKPYVRPTAGNTTRRVV